MQLPNKEKARLKDRHGDWAVVTGASSGIGLGFAAQLASAGFNLVTSARNLENLQNTERKLKAGANIQVICVAADISEPQGIDQVIGATTGLQVGLLVASAGYGTSGSFINGSLHAEIDMLRVNCEALLSLTH